MYFEYKVNPGATVPSVQPFLYENITAVPMVHFHADNSLAVPTFQNYIFN